MLQQAVGHVCDIKVTSYVACLHLLWYVGKRRPISILWYQVHKDLSGGLLFKFTGGCCYKRWLDKMRLKPNFSHKTDWVWPLNAPFCYGQNMYNISVLTYLTDQYMKKNTNMIQIKFFEIKNLRKSSKQLYKTWQRSNKNHAM